MAQKAKIIDVTRSYIPMDPKAFPENMLGTTQEDGPDQEPPIIPYEGKNFLPTAYGYKSYFGIDSTFDAPAFGGGEVDKAFVFQRGDLSNLYLILSDTGIWVLDNTIVPNIWVQHVSTTPLLEPAHNIWTTVTIENKLYMYQQGGLNVYVIKSFQETEQIALVSYDPILPLDAVPEEHYVFRLAIVVDQEPPGLINLPTAPTAPIPVYAGIDTIITTTLPTPGAQYRLLYCTRADFEAGIPDTDWMYLDYTYVDGVGITIPFADFAAPLGFFDISVNSGTSTTEGLITSFKPNFLNMPAQIGIFKANGRLGFWDSDNSVSWSSLFDHKDFEPSLITVAGNSKFNAVLGKITMILSLADGFVIYSTKSIVGITYSLQGTLLWDSTPITDKTGVAYTTQVCSGLTDKEHFAWTTFGLAHIGMPDVSSTVANKFKLDFIITPVYDYLKESRQPVRLDCLQDRYLFISVIDPKYISGNVAFYIDTIAGHRDTIMTGTEIWNREINILPTIIPGDTMAIVIKHLIKGVNINAQEFVGCLWRCQVHHSWVAGNSPFHAYLNGHRYLDFIYNIIQYNEGSGAFGNLPKLKTRGIIGDSLGNLSPGDPYYSKYFDLLWYFEPRRTADPIDGYYLRNYLYPLGSIPLQNPAYTYLEHLPNSNNPLKIAQNSIEEVMYRANLEFATHNLQRIIDKTMLDAWINNGHGYCDFNCSSETSVIVNVLGVPLKWYRVPAIPTIQYEQRSNINPPSTHLHAFTPYIDFEDPGYNTYGNMSTNLTGGLTFNFMAAWFLRTRYHLDISYTSTEELCSPTVTMYRWGVSGYGYVYAETLDEAIEQIIWVISTNHILTPFNSPGQAFHNSFTINMLEFSENTYSLDIEGEGGWGTHLTVTRSVAPAVNYVRITNSIDTYITKGASYIANTPTVVDFYISRESYVNALGNTIPCTYVDPITTISPPNSIQEASGLFILNGSVKSLNPWNVRTGTFGDRLVETRYTINTPDIYVPGYYKAGSHIIYPSVTADFPPISWQMQIGSPEPYYPVYLGAYVYDLALQKFGKMVQDFQVLTELTPINNHGVNTIPYSNFGMDAGIIRTDRLISIFTPNPTESWIRYGKIGYYRLGFTNILEAKVHFRTPSLGTFTVDSSYDGTGLENATKWSEAFGPTLNYTAKCDINGRWHTLTISGQYDIQFLEFRGNIQGMR